MSYLIGLDIGGTKCAVTLAEVNGEEQPKLLYKQAFPTAAYKTPDTALPHLAEKLCLALDGAGLTPKDVAGIGISCGGPLDSARGVILSPPNLPGWDEVYICRYFEERFGIPCHLQNDANASAVAEWRWGAGKGYRSIVFLTFGTGLGAGLILDGRLYVGAHDMAGEVGHIRMAKDGPVGYGKCGSAEGFCSGSGLRQLGIKALADAPRDSLLYRATEGDADRVTAKLLAELADAGDESARNIYRICAEKLGLLLSLLCDTVDPELILLGGIYMRSEHLLAEGIREVMAREALVPCEVRPAALGEKIGDFAALAVALL